MKKYKGIIGVDYSKQDYSTYVLMVRRCHNEKAAQYSRYGGRGIRVCDRWLSGIEFFIEDMGRRPEKSLTLDRIDNNAGYSPENCRWATAGENVKNRSVSKWWFINGVSFDSAASAAIEFKRSETTIRRWCEGEYYSDRKVPPKEGCWSCLKY